MMSKSGQTEDGVCCEVRKVPITHYYFSSLGFVIINHRRIEIEHRLLLFLPGVVVSSK